MPAELIKQITFTDVTTLNPDNTVEEGMALLKEHGLRCIPVIDKEGVFIGMFSSKEVLGHLAPLAGFMDENLAFAVGAASDLAERLLAFYPEKIEKFTEKNIYHIKPGTHTWESLRALVKYGSPLPVVDHDDNNKFVGLISEQSAIETLVDLCDK